MAAVVFVGPGIPGPRVVRTGLGEVLRVSGDGEAGTHDSAARVCSVSYLAPPRRQTMRLGEVSRPTCFPFQVVNIQHQHWTWPLTVAPCGNAAVPPGLAVSGSIPCH